jgi:orotidine-5'-phosphate decarboxylase
LSQRNGLSRDPEGSGSSCAGGESHFADRLAAAVESKHSALIVGLDPVLERLPGEILSRVHVGGQGAQGLTARAALAFGLFLDGVISAVADVAVGVKPNTAFFERYGAAGWDCLLQVCRKARKAGLLVIADAKRGDLAHTAENYAEALLGDLPDTLGPHVDAVTLSPYLGSDSAAPFLDAARRRGKGLFFLVRTSNRSAAEIQDLSVAGVPVYLKVAELVRRWGEDLKGLTGFSSVGAVVGATAPEEARRIRGALPFTPFLVPGYGAQGATADDLRACFLDGGRGAVVNASRSVLFAHEKREGSWVDAIRSAAAQARDEIERARM